MWVVRCSGPGRRAPSGGSSVEPAGTDGADAADDAPAKEFANLD